MCSACGNVSRNHGEKCAHTCMQYHSGVCVCVCVGAGFYLTKSSMSAGISCYLCHQSASIIRHTLDVQSIMWQRSVLTDCHIGAIIRSNQIKGELCIRVRKFHFLLL